MCVLRHTIIAIFYLTCGFVIAQTQHNWTLADTILADAYFTKGDSLLKAGNYESSINELEKARAIYEPLAIQFADATLWKNWVNCNLQIAENWRWQDKFKDALTLLETTLRNCTKALGINHLLRSLILDDIGNIYIHLGDYNSALESFEKALVLRELHLNANHSLIAESYSNIGKANRLKANLNAALEYEFKALEIRLKNDGESSLSVAGSYYNIGAIYFQKGFWDDALDNSEKALELFVKFYGENGKETAKVYQELGKAYERKGDLDNALVYINKALSINTVLFGENHSGAASNYNNIGTIYYTLADHEQALIYYQKFIDIRKDISGEFHPDIAIGYNNIGNVYAAKTEYETALAYYQNSYAIRKKTLPPDHSDLAQSLVNLAILFELMQDYEKAIDYNRRTLALLEPNKENNRLLVAAAYKNLGIACFRVKKFEEAEAYINIAYPMQQQLFGEKHPRVALTCQSFGELYFVQNQLVKALEYFQRSLNILANNNIAVHAENHSPEEYSNRNYAFNALRFKANLFKRRYLEETRNIADLKMALETAQSAVQLAALIRSSYFGERSKLLLTEKTMGVFGEGIEIARLLYLQTGNRQFLKTAFDFAEQSKAMVLAEELKVSRAKQFAGIPDTLLAREKDLRIDLAFYETEINKEKWRKSGTDTLKLKEFEDRQFILKREYEQLVERFEKEFPHYYDMKYRVETAGISDVQQSLDDRTAVLSYFLGDSSLTVFAVQHNDFQIEAVPIDSVFRKTVARFITACKTGFDKNDFTETAPKLYETLIRPIEGMLANKQNLVIIPDGELARLPFEALAKQVSPDMPYDKIEYLIKSFNISYHLSASLLLQKLRSRSQKKYDQEWIAFAPVFNPLRHNGVLQNIETGLPWHTTSQDAFGHFRTTEDGQQLAELPFSELEVTSVQQIFDEKGLPNRIFLHESAREDSFKTRVYSSRIVHVATHGKVNEEHPALSNLVFSQTFQQDSGQDGVLFAPEIYQLQMKADLLVLSACETGAGKLARGEGLLSITRAFMYAGANNILATLWKVLDQDASALMVALYQQILSGKPYTEALRAAKLTLIHQPETASPYSWSGFVLTGK